MGAPAPAPAQGSYLQHLDAIGKLDEARGSREEACAEVGRDAECIDIDAELVDDVSELLDLLGCVELSLVADEVVEAPARRQVVDDDAPEVERRLHLDRGRAQSEPT